MERSEFERILIEVVSRLVLLVVQRNLAYAGADPLKCWRKRGLAGLLVRLEDKLLRFETFLERGGATEEEWGELLQDIGGYALCGLLWLGRGEDAHVMSEDEMTKPRYAKTTCRTCRHRGPDVHVGVVQHRTCLRHRSDGDAQAMSPAWIAALEADEEHCELYQPEEGKQAR
jgi:hypothetical protein